MKPNRAPDVVRRDLFGGTGAVSVWSLLRGSTDPFTACLSCELEPGGRVGEHVQQEFPELVVGIEGDGAATVNGDAFPLTAGSVVFLPHGSTLSIRNESPEAPLRYLIVKARGR